MGGRSAPQRRHTAPAVAGAAMRPQCLADSVEKLYFNVHYYIECPHRVQVHSEKAVPLRCETLYNRVQTQSANTFRYKLYTVGLKGRLIGRSLLGGGLSQVGPVLGIAHLKIS